MITEPTVTLMGWTHFDADKAIELTGWGASGPHSWGEAAIEFAGRACYQSWHKPNEGTRDNADYIGHILDVGHFSVLEHAMASFYITGVSRSLTHELIRHRHVSPSQLSQRFVDESETDWVCPPVYLDSKPAQDLLAGQMEAACATYRHLVAAGEFTGLTRKQAREAARCVLPNMVETRIYLTGNFRAWRELIGKRLDQSADAEIQRLAAIVGHELMKLAPSVFGDVAAAS